MLLSFTNNLSSPHKGESPMAADQLEKHTEEAVMQMCPSAFISSFWQQLISHVFVAEN